MAYISDSSSDEDLGAAISQVVAEDITGAAWYAERRSEEEVDAISDAQPVEENVKIASRAYQLEMLDASLKENVIVAMDTGSGKTQVYDQFPRSYGSTSLMINRAVLRIEAELRKMAPDQVSLLLDRWMCMSLLIS